MAAICHYYTSSDNSGQTATDHLIPMVGRQLANSPNDNNPTTMGSQCATELNAMDAGHRYFMPSKCLQELQSGITPIPDSALELFTNGFNIGPFRERVYLMLRAMYDGLDDPDSIDFICLNELEYAEAYVGYNYEALGGNAAARAAVAAAVIADPVASRMMPPLLRSMSESDLAAWTSYSDNTVNRAIAEWNWCVMSLAARAIRDTIVAPFAEVFGYLPPLTNYDEHRGLSAWFQYPWGEMITKNPLAVGGMASTAIYTNSATFAGKSKPGWWNMFIWRLNYVRLTGGAPRKDWINAPGFTGGVRTTNFDLWDEMMNHLAAMGFGDFLGFTNGWTNGEKTHMEDTLAAMDVAATVSVPKALIEYDADEITTNGYTTTYDVGLAP